MGACHDWGVGFAHSELLECFRNRRIAFQIEPGKQHAVLRQKIADTKSILRVTGTDSAQSDEPVQRTQQLPAGDERLQNDVAQLRILIQTLMQGLARQLVDFAIRLRDAAHHCRVPGQMSHVAGEVAGMMRGNGLWLVAGYIDNLNLARPNHEKLEVAIAGAKKRLARAKLFWRRPRVTSELRHLLFAQRRKRNRIEISLRHRSKLSTLNRQLSTLGRRI